MLRDDLLDMGHDGACDALCGRPAAVIIAEAAEPWCACGGCADGAAAIAAYCEGHGAAAARAARADVERNAEWRLGGLWRAVLDAWPQPVAIAAEAAQ